MTPHKEKRNFERLDLRLKAFVLPVDKQIELKTMDYETINVCAGGAYFRTTYPLPSGTNVSVSLFLPGSGSTMDHVESTIELTGHILRSNDNGMAVSFNRSYKLSPYNSDDEPTI